MRHKLTALGIKNAADGKHGDGAGLILVKSGATGKWIFRYTHLGRRRDMGLGQWPQLTLAAARTSRDRWQAILANGQDPMDVRDQERAAARQELEKSEATFAHVCALVFEARKLGLRGEGTRGRWLSPLTTHILPAIGNKPVSRLTRHDYAAALRPIWRTKHPTALKAQRRLELVIREGRYMGFNCDPFEAEAAVRILGEVRHVEHKIPATPWQELPDLFGRLGTGSAAECLRLLILTLARSNACTGARKEEFAGDFWTIPKERMKGTEESAADFRVPLSSAAREVVERQMEVASGPYLFPNANGGPIDGKRLDDVLNRLKEPGRPHGMRSTFKTWVQDTEACSWEVSETILAHSIGTKVTRAYARSDIFERRQIAMEAWARFVTGAQSNVVRLLKG